MMEDERLMNSDGGENRDGEENGGDDDDPLPPLVEVFNIPELLQQILIKVEDVDDMKSLRLMSKQWRDLTLDNWRKTAVFSLATEEAKNALKLTLGMDEGVSPLAAVHGATSATTIYRFQDKPFKQYRLEEGLIFPPKLPSLEHKLYFWEKCGPSITYLNLPECFFKKGLYLEGLHWILSSCPNLEELNFAPYKYIVKGRDIDIDSDDESDSSDEDEDNLWEKYKDEDEENVIYRIPKNQTKGACSGGVSQAGHKLTSLTISYSYKKGAMDDPKILFTNIKVGTAFFGTIPNVTTMVIKNLNSCCTVIAEALDKHATESSEKLLPFIHLKKFFTICSWLAAIVLEDFSNYLTNHNPELKTLQLDYLNFSEILGDPFQLKNTLKAIKEHVEEIDLSLECDDDDWPERWNARVLEPLKPNSCFDLFNLRFPKLTKLTLVFEYSSDDYAKFLSFDFGMLRGTPNLKYFRFGTAKDLKYFVVEKLGVQDLIKRKEQSWHRADGEERRIPHEYPNRIRVQEEEPFLPGEEIILEKMEEFHYEGVFNDEALRFLGNTMKNLKVLETVLDEKTFHVPFQVWGGEKLRKLTALTMAEDALEDTVIAEQQRKYPKVEVTKIELPKKPGWVSLSSKELEALPIRPTN